MTIPTQPELTIKSFVSKAVEQGIELQHIAGPASSSRVIRSPRIERPGLAFVGRADSVRATRLQVLGETEIGLLRQIPPENRFRGVMQLLAEDVPCLLVTKGLEIPQELIDGCNEKAVPLFRTTETTHLFIDRLLSFLRDMLAIRTKVHGVMVDVHGVGVLITGESGIGKSESALDLILRGHRLVADDIVEIKAYPPRTLIAKGPSLVRHHMEVRGLGIISIKDLYGVAAIREYKRLELVAELVPWSSFSTEDRVGIEQKQEIILDIPISKVQIPVSPGRNITSIIEVAARIHMLRRQGVDSAREFNARLNQQIIENAEDQSSTD